MAHPAAGAGSLGWADLNPDAKQPVADLKLPPEQPVRVRLVDVTGAPAHGVEVRLMSIGQQNDRGQFEGVSTPGASRTWPGPVVTDGQGKFTLHGLGHGVNLYLSVRDLRFARQDLHIDTDVGADGKEITLALEPARIIEGRVLAADTGRPIANAVVSASALVMNGHAQRLVHAPSSCGASAEGRIHDEPGPWQSASTPRCLPDRRRAVPDPAGRAQVDQGDDQGDA